MTISMNPRPSPQQKTKTYHFANFWTLSMSPLDPWEYFNNIYHESSTIPLGKPMGFHGSGDRGPSGACFAWTLPMPGWPKPPTDSCPATRPRLCRGGRFRTTWGNGQPRGARWCLAERWRGICPLEMWVEPVDVAMPLDAIALSIFGYL